MKLKIFAIGLLAGVAPVCSHAVTLAGGYYCDTAESVLLQQGSLCKQTTNQTASLYTIGATDHCRTTRTRTVYAKLYNDLGIGSEWSVPCYKVTVTDCATCKTNYAIQTQSLSALGVSGVDADECITAQTCSATENISCDPNLGGMECPSDNAYYECDDSTGVCKYTKIYVCQYNSTAKAHICTLDSPDNYKACLLGWYGDGSTCTKCQSPGTTLPAEGAPGVSHYNSTSVDTCFVPAGYTGSDTTGSYKIIDNGFGDGCYWQ